MKALCCLQGIHQTVYDADKVEAAADHHFISGNDLRLRLANTTSAATRALTKAKAIGHRKVVDLLCTADIASRAMGMTLPGRHLREMEKFGVGGDESDDHAGEVADSASE